MRHTKTGSSAWKTAISRQKVSLPFRKHLLACGYVLNVLTNKEGQQVIDNIHDLLGKRGKAFVVVRRDIKKPGLTSKGTYQRNVKLEGACVTYKCSKYEVYTFWKGEDIGVK